MNPKLKLAISGLRWVLGLVVLLESVNFVLSPADQLAKSGLPLWLRPVLGGSEAVAAALFLTPVTSRAGGYALICIFAIAAGIHFLHGQFDVGNLFIYAVATLVCVAYGSGKPSKMPPDPSSMSDEELIASFESCTLAPGSFHHADHIRMAFLYLRRYQPLDALHRFSTSLMRFATAHGKPELYH